MEHFFKNKTNIKLTSDISYGNRGHIILQWYWKERLSLLVEMQLHNDKPGESVQYTYLILATTNRSLNRKRCRSCLCRPLLSSTRPSISRVRLEHTNDDRNAHVSRLAEGLSLWKSKHHISSAKLSNIGLFLQKL